MSAFISGHLQCGMSAKDKRTYQQEAYRTPARLLIAVVHSWIPRCARRAIRRIKRSPELTRMSSRSETIASASGRSRNNCSKSPTRCPGREALEWSAVSGGTADIIPAPAVNGFRRSNGMLSQLLGGVDGDAAASVHAALSQDDQVGGSSHCVGDRRASQARSIESFRRRAPSGRLTAGRTSAGRCDRC